MKAASTWIVRQSTIDRALLAVLVVVVVGTTWLVYTAASALVGR